MDREKFVREAYPHMADKDLHVAAEQSDSAPELETDKSIEYANEIAHAVITS